MVRNGEWDWHGEQAKLQPIIVDKNNNIQSGHHRVLAADKAGIQIPETAIQRLCTESPRPVYDWVDILGDD